jgi:hypothetical protein
MSTCSQEDYIRCDIVKQHAELIKEIEKLEEVLKIVKSERDALAKAAIFTHCEKEDL